MGQLVHDVRGPLTVIKTSVQMAARHGHASGELLVVVTDQVDRAQALLELLAEACED